MADNAQVLHLKPCAKSLHEGLVPELAVGGNEVVINMGADEDDECLVNDDVEAGVNRDTSTDTILKIYKLTDNRPEINEFENTLKSPSGEPTVGSGNFAVKK